MEHERRSRIDTITTAIDAGLAEAERMRITDQSTIHGEVWLQLNEGVQRGDYTIDEALGRYRAWHNTYALGSTAVADMPPNVIPIRQPEPPDIVA